MEQFTGLKHPIQNYPFRQALGVVKYLIPYIKNKSVCDLGCGCGDILVEMQKHAKSIVGIENDLRFKQAIEDVEEERKFIIWGDLFEVDIPKCDVYFIWISSDKKMNEKIINLLEEGVIIIDPTIRLDLFSGNKNLELIDTIECSYDESEYIGFDDIIIDGNPFPSIGERKFKIYKKIS